MSSRTSCGTRAGVCHLHITLGSSSNSCRVGWPRQQTLASLRWVQESLRSGGRSRCAERQESQRRGGMSAAQGIKSRDGRQEAQLRGQEPVFGWVGRSRRVRTVGSGSMNRCTWWQELAPGRQETLLLAAGAFSPGTEQKMWQWRWWKTKTRRGWGTRLVHVDPVSRLPVWTYQFVARP